MISLSSLSSQLSFDFMDGFPAVSSRPGVQSSDWFIPNSSDPGTHLLGLLGVPVLIHRSHSLFEQYFTVPYKGEVFYQKYHFELVDTDALLFTFALDNAPTADSSVTLIGEAFDHMNSFWPDGDYAPLDWYAFAFLIEQQQSGEDFLAALRRRYCKYKKVTIVFADVLRGGPNQEPLYVLYDLNVNKPESQGEFRLSQNVAPYHLSHGQTFVTCCVEKSRVIVREENVSPVKKTQSEPLAPVDISDDDSRFAFDLAGYIASGCVSHEEFIRVRGMGAYKPRCHS